MRLPHADRAYVDLTKITGYLLSATHRDGHSKARAFTAAGYSLNTAQLLADQFAQLARTGTARPGKMSAFGNKYEIDGIIQCPSGHPLGVRTVWIVRADEDFPRFVTTHPRRQR